jgi:hypothetical protein
MKTAILIAMIALASPAKADPVDCKMAEVNQGWIDHYTDWKERLIAQGMKPEALTGMDQAIARFQKAYDESVAKCSR